MEGDDEVRKLVRGGRYLSLIYFLSALDAVRRFGKGSVVTPSDILREMRGARPAKGWVLKFLDFMVAAGAMSRVMRKASRKGESAYYIERDIDEDYKIILVEAWLREGVKLRT